MRAHFLKRASALTLLVASLIVPGRTTAQTSGTPGVWNNLNLRRPTSDALAWFYDPASDRAIMVTPRAVHDTIVDGHYSYVYAIDTWSLDMRNHPAWRLLAAAHQPPPVANDAVFDPVSRRLLYDTGDGAIWQFSLTNNDWSNAIPSGPVRTQREGVTAVLDTRRRNLLLFGGAQGELFYDDIWAFSLTDMSWAPLETAGQAPPGFVNGGVYDPVRDRVIVVDKLGHTWVLALSDTSVARWSMLLTAGPAVPFGACTTYDSARDRMLLCDPGWYGTPSVWAFSLADDSWSHLPTMGTGPPGDLVTKAVYDPREDRMLVYEVYHCDTMECPQDPVPGRIWALSLSGTPAWSEFVVPWPDIPPAGGGLSAIARNGHMVLFGGEISRYTGAFVTNSFGVWDLNPATDWSRVATAGDVPPMCLYDSAIYDAPRDRMIVFGGFNEGSLLNDLWALSFAGTTPTWSRLAAAGTPPTPRYAHGAIYDPKGERMIVYGGGVGPSIGDDDSTLYQLTLSGIPTWSVLAPAGPHPGPLRSVVSVLDTLRHRMLIFGGTSRPDVWALSLDDPPSWTLIAVAGAAPSGTMGAVGVYDEARDRLVVATGRAGSFVNPTGAMFELSLSGTPTWTQLGTAGAIPGRYDAVAIADPVGDRVLVFGGEGVFTAEYPETWELRWSSGTTATLVDLIDASADRVNGVRVIWNCPTCGDVPVEKSEDGGKSWRVAGRATSDGRGRLSYVDPVVLAGRRYGYRPQLPSGASAVAWVTTPLAELGRVRAWALSKSIAIEAAGTAGLEKRVVVCDVAGRVIARDTWNHGDRHEVMTGVLPASVYFVQIRADTRARTARVVVLR